jgi:hypothetical protein
MDEVVKKLVALGVPVGTRFTIKEVHWFESFCCQGRRVVATINGAKLNDKYVDISQMFMGPHNLRLNENRGQLCEF